MTASSTATCQMSSHRIADDHEPIVVVTDDSRNDAVSVQINATLS
jgi:hypothetical protein